MWDPRITYDASTGLFYMVSRHTATNGFWCPAGTPLNYHISLMSFDGSGLAVEVYPAGSGDCNGTGFPVSAMTGTYPGDQLPRHPMLALGGPGKLLIAWDDARNQGSGGNQRDLYGTLILPPANDQCSGALPLVDNVYSAVSTTNATDDGTSTCLGVTRRKGVWFTYTPAQDGTATLDTCPSDFGTAVEVFTGTCGNLNSIGCTNNSPTCSVTNRASYSFPCTAGTTYMIWAGGNYGAFGNLQIRAHLVPGPSPNDDCTGAIALYENVYYSQSTVSATDDGESRCFKGMARYHGVWFTYTAPQTGVAAVDTCGTRYNNLIEVFTGPCATLHGISCFLGSAECVGNSGQNDCKFSCTAGTTYTICVSSTQGASGLLDVRARMVPANDQCDGAFALSDNVYYPENTATATDDGYSSCLGPRTKGVWFTYTPAASGTVIVDTVPSDFWPSVEFFTGTCSNLTSIGCNTNCAFCTGGDTSYLAGTAGTTYTICVGGYNGASGNLQIRAHSLAVPRAPRLVLTLVDTNTVGLTIYGDIGHVHDIQVNRSLSSPNWITLNSVTLTSDPQYFTLIRPANSAFWRAIAH
jgi:hypothetical protein